MSNRYLNLRKISPREAVSMMAVSVVGCSLSSAHPVGIAASVMMPAIAMCQSRRRAAYAVGAVYYAMALWPLIPGARNFFGPGVSALVAVGLWAFSFLLLALPWLLIWSPRRREALWRVPVGIALTVIPPLGIVGWASPLTAAGILFPGTAWWGLLLCAVSTGALVVWPRRTAAFLAVLALACNTSFRPLPQPPDWEAVSTAFGGIAHGNRDPIAEYAAAQWIQEKALTARAKVLIFPETVVPTWTPATDAFWQQTLDQLRSSGKTILVGVLLPATMPQASIEPYNFSANLAALRGQPSSLLIRQSELDLQPAAFAYDNAVVVRGADTAIFKQRIPVPIAMWNPLKTGAGRLNLNAAGVVDLHQHRAAILVCYEQLLTWPVLVSMAQRPTILIAIANDYWATGTPIPAFQLAAVRAWARLFSLPYFSAVNR